MANKLLVVCLGPTARDFRNVLIEIQNWDGKISHYNEESVIEDMMEWARALKEAMEDSDLILADSYSHY